MATEIVTSRVFVKGLPPTLAEPEFRKHFSAGGRAITEVRLFSDRRIGYVGYKTVEDATSAVKYFNKTFVRMSRISVELARPPRAQRDNARTPIPMEHGSDVNQKSEVQQSAQDDAKLKEFLDVMKPKSRKRGWDQNADFGDVTATNDVLVAAVEAANDSEYEELPRDPKRHKQEPLTPISIAEDGGSSAEDAMQDGELREEAEDIRTARQSMSDDAWLKSHTRSNDDAIIVDVKHGRRRPVDMDAGGSSSAAKDDVNALAVEQIRESMRLFIRNLSFETTNADLEAEFAEFDHVEEVHVARSKKTGAGKGFAYIQFSDPTSAANAFEAKDGHIFQGRLLHIIPASAKRDSNLDSVELAKLPLKKQKQIQRRREASSTQFNWNTLYMNPDAVVSSVAAQLGVAKSAILDPTSSDAAVKQAHAETHVIQETKSYFKSQGVDLDAFKRSQRGDTVILVKNVPFDTTRDDLRRLFEEHGEIRRFLMPPSGVIAIIEMSNAVQAQSAFGALAYKRHKSSMLFLEKGPKDLFTSIKPLVEEDADGKVKLSTTDLKTDSEDLIVKPSAGTATLFVRNLNFDTTNQQLTEAFSPLTGFLSARIKTKTDPKKPGQTLSMGFGFVELRNAADAQAALRTMDGYTLHGHKLQVRASNKGIDAAEEQRQAARAKREASQQTKVIIKNLPFEVSKKDVRALFGAYGQLRSVRVPKKMDRAARGFAFADFTTPKEAQAAIDALRDTHLLGRRLVLDFADEDPVDAEAEIERMAAKVGGQTNAVAVQRLTGQGRKKFSTRRDEDEES